MAVRTIAHPSVDDRRAQGLAARDRTPPSSHSGWTPAGDRPDQNERDYQAFTKAIGSGRLQAREGI